MVYLLEYSRDWRHKIDNLRILAAVLALMIAGSLAAPAPLAAQEKLSWWDLQRKGANNFNRRPLEGWWRDAREAGIGLVRLAPDKWQGEGRDFLLGDADRFRGIPPADLALLRRQLDCAQENGIRVVLTMLSLPGCRWAQNNGGEEDRRLWRDPEYLLQAAAFWRELAAALRDHPAVVGYDLLNEPHPERLPETAALYRRDPEAWLAQVRGGPADLNAFYAALIAAAREVDPDTPVIVESGLWASPERFCCLAPQADPKVLYSFHMYEPYEYTTLRVNEGRYAYPSRSALHRRLNPAGLRRILEPVGRWRREHGLPANRIFAAELGCDRGVAGAAEYLADVIAILNAGGWHWAFYAFREDGWDRMDYEKGPGSLWRVLRNELGKPLSSFFPLRENRFTPRRGTAF